jgi:RNase P/RNase MRP subunit POP5
MLKRRSKRRYLSLVQADESTDPTNAIEKRFSELFGTIATDSADIRLIEQRRNAFIIRCAMADLENILVAIALTDPPVITVDMSGTIRQLRRRWQHSDLLITESP